MSNEKNKSENMASLASSISQLKNTQKKTTVSKGLRNAYLDMSLPTSKGAKNGDKYKLNAGLAQEEFQKLTYMQVKAFAAKGKTELAEMMVNLMYELMCDLNDEGIDLFEKSNGKPNAAVAKANIYKYISSKSL